MTEHFGGKLIFGLGNLFSAIFCLLTPLCARHGGANALIAIRVLTGLAQADKFKINNYYSSRKI